MTQTSPAPAATSNTPTIAPASAPATEASFGLSHIGQIAVTVHDLEKAIPFYRDTLGLPFLFRVPNLAFFDCAGTRLMLSHPEQPELDRGNSILYFTVPDIQAAYRTLAERGVTFVDEPHCIAKLEDREVWMVFLRDPENNMLGLMSEPPRVITSP